MDSTNSSKKQTLLLAGGLAVSMWAFYLGAVTLFRPVEVGSEAPGEVRATRDRSSVMSRNLNNRSSRSAEKSARLSEGGENSRKKKSQGPAGTFSITH